MIAWTLDALMIYFIFSAFGLSFDIVLTTFVSYVSLLLGAISSIPAGIGVRELSCIGLLIRNNVDTPVATTLVFLIRIFPIWIPTVIGITSTKNFLRN